MDFEKLNADLFDAILCFEHYKEEEGLHRLQLLWKWLQRHCLACGTDQACDCPGRDTD